MGGREAKERRESKVKVSNIMPTSGTHSHSLAPRQGRTDGGGRETSCDEEKSEDRAAASDGWMDGREGQMRGEREIRRSTGGSAERQR